MVCIIDDYGVSLGVLVVEKVDCVLAISVKEIEVESCGVKALGVDGFEDVVVIDSADVYAREVLLP